MKLKDRIIEKINVLSVDYYDRPPATKRETLRIYGVLIKKLLSGAIDLVNASFRLRNCIKGERVTVKGKLKVQAKGKIIIGDDCRIWSHIGTTQISAGPRATIEIGENTFINTGTIITARKYIKIGKNCHIANQVIMMDDDFHDIYQRDSKSAKETITIGDHVWLATRCMILKGVTIGEGAVVAAGAVVAKDVPPYTLVGGVPAKFISAIKGNETDREIEKLIHHNIFL
jgi:acetyltransferase-like isoleucine patch superfamily enzyme